MSQNLAPKKRPSPITEADSDVAPPSAKRSKLSAEVWFEITTMYTSEPLDEAEPSTDPAVYVCSTDIPADMLKFLQLRPHHFPLDCTCVEEEDVEADRCSVFTAPYGDLDEVGPDEILNQRAADFLAWLDERRETFPTSLPLASDSSNLPTVCPKVLVYHEFCG